MTGPRRFADDGVRWWCGRATSKTFLRASSMPFCTARPLLWPCRSRGRRARAVADDHEGGEGDAGALDHLGHPVHPDGALFVLCFGHGLRTPVFFAGGVGQDGDAAVVDEATAVEHDGGDAGFLGPGGEQVPTLGAGTLPPPPSSRAAQARWRTPAPRYAGEVAIAGAEMLPVDRLTARRAARGARDLGAHRE